MVDTGAGLGDTGTNNTRHASPLEAHQAGFSISDMSSPSSSPFTKPATSLDQQVDLLCSRGMRICDRQQARHYLQTIGYYRLSGYWLSFRTSTSAFLPGTTFEAIVDLYVFDRELRLLVMDAIERIEVAVRTTISDHMSMAYGPHWYLDPAHFNGTYNHTRLIQDVQDATGHTARSGTLAHKKRDLFIQHYYDKYDYPTLPPSWMIAEVLPMGTWSLIYAHLANYDDRKAVAALFGLHHHMLGSWLHALTYLRNLCAHHSRVWNRVMTLKPKIAKHLPHLMGTNDRFHAHAVVLWHFMQRISPGTD